MKNGKPGLIVKVLEPVQTLSWMSIDSLLDLRVDLIDEADKKPLGSYRLGDLIIKLR